MSFFYGISATTDQWQLLITAFIYLDTFSVWPRTSIHQRTSADIARVPVTSARQVRTKRLATIAGPRLPKRQRLRHRCGSAQSDPPMSAFRVRTHRNASDDVSIAGQHKATRRPRRQHCGSAQSDTSMTMSTLRVCAHQNTCDGVSLLISTNRHADDDDDNIAGQHTETRRLRATDVTCPQRGLRCHYPGESIIALPVISLAVIDSGTFVHVQTMTRARGRIKRSIIGDETSEIAIRYLIGHRRRGIDQYSLRQLLY